MKLTSQDLEKKQENMTSIFLYANDTIAKVGKSHLMTPEFLRPNGECTWAPKTHVTDVTQKQLQW